MSNTGSYEQVAFMLQWLYKQRYSRLHTYELSQVDCQAFVTLTLCSKSTRNHASNASYNVVFFGGKNYQMQVWWEM